MSNPKKIAISVFVISSIIGIGLLVNELVTDKIVTEEIEREIASEKAELKNDTAETGGATEARAENDTKAPADSRTQIDEKFDYILLSGRAEKKQFLRELCDALKAYKKNGDASNEYLSDSEALATILAQLALDDIESVSSLALQLINLLAFVPASHPDLPDLSQSTEIKTALEQLILIDDTDDGLKGRAINAHSLLFPPEDALISEFEQIIARGGFEEGVTLTAIFKAFSNYQRLHNYDMPASTLELTKKLIEHPLDSVKAKAMYSLSERLGKPFLPVLFNELKGRHGLSVQDRIVVNILFLDQSDETIRKLKEFAAELPEGSYIAKIIKNKTSPQSIEHYKKMSKQREADQ